MASSSHYSSNALPRFLSSRRMDNGPSFYLLPLRNRLSSYLPHHSHHCCRILLRRSKRKLILGQAISGTGGFSAPIISPGDHWGMWTTLFATASFGIWSEKTRVGSAISGAMVSILVGLVASSVGLISADSPVYYIVLEFLLPLAVPLLLFNADLRRIMKSTGTLLLAFLIGSVATTIGTLVAYLIVPMRSLGQDSWKIAAALMSRHIGGAVSEALGVSPSVLSAGLAADNVVCAIYFTSLFALASNIPAELSPSPHENLLQNGHQDRDKLSDDHKQANNLPVLQSAMAITVSFTICKLGTYINNVIGLQGGKLPCITAIIVVLATMFPTQFGALAPSGEAIALLLMQLNIANALGLANELFGLMVVLQVFFAVVGANGSVRNVINTTPAIFAYSTIQIAVHVAVILGLGKLFGFEKKILLIASNANVGGPTTACGMATAKGWNSLIIPGILAGVMGVAIATFICIGFGLFVLKHM